METQLVRAQKVEAIGTLAGGVAHDLNNVLSGTTSYPEMLLWNLDVTNPMHMPLMTIQQAGEKAAEIVQALLTLARRGVTTKEIVNLNDIIGDCLDSPEYVQMISYHHDIAVTSDPDPNLLHLKGSPIHIRKTIMNLVSNAAEARPEGGEISISTYNRSVDLPEKGYEKIRQGDFVTLEIADRGCGISEEDKERIFASSIWETLNYKAVTAASGEAALAYIKQRVPDILLLDMIMEPGMDGLETYRGAVEIHPDQKAIIASGFAQNRSGKGGPALGRRAIH